MRYLKTFENFSGVVDWKSVIENNENFADIKQLIETEPVDTPRMGAAERIEIITDFEDLVNKLSSVDIKMIEPLFYDFELSSGLLAEEFKKLETTYRLDSNMTSESIQNIDPKSMAQSMAQQALKYILGLGIMAGLVKLFYMVGEYLFMKLDEYGVYSVVGGVLLILIYLAVFGGKKSKEVVKSDDDYTDFEEI
jgi:hypothetical protein